MGNDNDDAATYIKPDSNIAEAGQNHRATGADEGAEQENEQLYKLPYKFMSVLSLSSEFVMH